MSDADTAMSNAEVEDINVDDEDMPLMVVESQAERRRRSVDNSRKTA